MSVRGHDFEVEVSNSVFSNHRLDLGTKVLLDRVPSAEDLPAAAHILDLGCGWGPITLAVAAEAPQDATIWALDVNERAVELTRRNAEKAGFSQVRAGTVDSLESTFSSEWTDAAFDLIWSNPPIRIGKEALHTLLMTYLPRLARGGHAYLVVQKHLGADPLIGWLEDNLNSNTDTSSDMNEQRFTVSKFASAKGYRIIEVTRN
nr:methyltransferase [Alloscardovia criceti]